jgi:hypothetical protein
LYTCHVPFVFGKRALGKMERPKKYRRICMHDVKIVAPQCPL